MATRKKKAKQEVTEEVTWPKVTKGSHLTVTEYEDGKVDMLWDEEALARDVRNAIALFEKK